MGIYQRSGCQASAGRRFAVGLRLAVTGWVLASLAASAAAQAPYVPTPPDVVQRMLTMAKVTATDYVVDLGSGDGRVVREAARRYKARGLGIEHDAELVARSVELARREGVSDRVAFLAQDLFATEIGEATVVTMYLLPAINMKLRPRLLEKLRPGTRIVSHDFDMGDWLPDETVKMYSKDKYSGTGGDSTIHLWVVPADVSGRWQWQLEFGGRKIDYELRAAQRFQQLEVTVRADGQQSKVEQVGLRGDSFNVTVQGELKGSTVRQQFSGRVVGDEVVGTVVLSGVRMHGLAEWSAARTERGFRSAQAPARLSYAEPSVRSRP